MSDNGPVFVAWLHPLQVHAVFADSLLGLVAYDFFREHDGKPRQIAGMKGYEAGVNISTPRNEVILEFLTAREEPWILLIDVDMQFPPDALERLLEHADRERAPIVGGLCFGTDHEGRLWPTLYDLTELDEGPCFARLTDFSVAKPLLRVDATGAAFLLIHRSVLERVREQRFPEDPGHHYPWFQETQLSGGPLGEDLTFMLRAGICGFPVHVLTSLHIGHLKHHMLTAYKYFKQEGRIVEPPPPDATGLSAPSAPTPLPPRGSGEAPRPMTTEVRRGQAVTAVPR